jgi:hypothetical protein
MSHPNPHHDPENVRSEDSKFAPKAKNKALKKMSGKWHSIGAGRVGDRYKGGIIKKIDAKNAKAFVR